MKIEFEINKNSIKAKFNKNEEHIFNLNEEVNLTEYVEKISNSDSLIELSPMKCDEVASFEGSSEDIKKLLKYLYQIPEKFNEAFEEVNKSQNS